LEQGCPWIRKKDFARNIAGYLIAIGLFFGLASFLDIRLLHFDQTGRIFFGISECSCLFRCRIIFFIAEGRTKKKNGRPS
jgi:hypothetical protein